jgi:outer membrane murein-binding lipoprotein Lpp
MATGKKAEQDDVIKRLAGRGEETLQKLTELPGGKSAAKAFNELRSSIDELGKKVRGIDKLEARVDKLERDVATLRRAQKAAGPKAPAKKPASP